MKYLKNSVNCLLSDDLSVEERGVLITVILTRDPDPRIGLAKLKRKLNTRRYKKSLVSLHEKGYISYSKYKTAKKSLKDKDDFPKVEEVISFLNNLYGTRFKPSSMSATVNLRNRLKDYSVEDCKLVVANRYKEWKDDPIMSKYLTPHTIFRPSKFEKYFEEAKRTKSGVSLIEESRGDLVDGERITYSLAKTLNDKEAYGVRIYTLSGNRRIGSGQDKKITGKNLKLALKILSKQKEKSAEYVYKK